MYQVLKFLFIFLLIAIIIRIEKSYDFFLVLYVFFNIPFLFVWFFDKYERTFYTRHQHWKYWKY